ncbi:hypothetical protein Avbf_10988 [Armadillidium vulgare]|nr:hypothetical protein Avbf_10988 [Armadillidium vulgare]
MSHSKRHHFLRKMFFREVIFFTVYILCSSLPPNSYTRGSYLKILPPTLSLCEKSKLWYPFLVVSCISSIFLFLLNLTGYN